MTLIACTLNHKRPFILGDLLISSPGAKKSIQLPTNTIDITEYLQSNKGYATDLYQKIYIINNNVALALAGDVSEMINFLEEFKMRCSYYDSIDENGIRNFLDDFNLGLNFKGSAFFILLMVREKNLISVKQFWSPKELWGTVESDVFENVHACGTGKEDFLHYASEQQTFTASSEKGDILRAIAANFGFIAKLLAVERATLHTITKNWGGGFETIFFNGNAFIKLDEIAYITNYAQFDENGNVDFLFPQLVQYYKYYKDVLFIISIEIRSFEHEENNKQMKLTSKDCRVDIFPVPRLDLKPGSPIELPPEYSFVTSRLALGYTIITKNNKIYAPSFFMESTGTNVLYKDGEHVEILLDKGMTDLIKEGAKKAFPNL